ncbi:MAG: thiamine pyrophosphate-dependent dehydrogenase E1 component subunit alpha [Deltaproteobacteria bacterium]|nr:thiamine pyrophosphate-dependent dehydrogenase E1 component subunit alpha [Deltaproteobacteria bacterium]MBW2398558.1 thiamine pyrophosphate-dependent dehydrogenase E1 component subunit alpha [Deltaproteobacteria bacterium]MBW2665616.1 thiamine pyrophosphate-dependent dehydrogenase E1 component subunit alpha [Deltaproteobacteria bacterium]
MPPTDTERIALLRSELAIRVFEEAVKKQFAAGLIPGSVHLSIGHEAAIAGGCAALATDDYVIGTHRSHGHPIAKGADFGPLMAELMGRVDGVCKGKGGSMHLTDHSVGVMGESGIVGGGLPLAAGAGLSAKVLGNGRVCLCFFGDGASNEGSFHESLNLAAIWQLPVIYLCENNLYGATTPARSVIAVEDIADRAASYAIPGVVVDGQDAEAVYAVVAEAVERARRGDGPSLIEAKTYRYGEHAEGLIIPVTYRDESEVEEWKLRDPVAILRARLIGDGVLREDAAEALEAELRQQVAEAVAFAKNSPLPEPEAAFDDVYSNPIAGGAR